MLPSVVSFAACFHLEWDMVLAANLLIMNIKIPFEFTQCITRVDRYFANFRQCSNLAMFISLCRVLRALSVLTLEINFLSLVRNISNIIFFFSR